MKLQRIQWGRGVGGITETCTGVFMLTEYYEKHFSDLVLVAAWYNQQEITYQFKVKDDTLIFPGMIVDEFDPSSSKSFIISRVLLYCCECEVLYTFILCGRLVIQIPIIVMCVSSSNHQSSTV